jgi:hypothetical protein
VNDATCPPGTKHDAGKPRYDLLPWSALDDVAAVLTYGSKKYAPGNWMKVPDGRARYSAAALRHLSAYLRGELLDPESHLPHLAHATCCLLFLAWFDQSGSGNDSSGANDAPGPTD